MKEFLMNEIYTELSKQLVESEKQILEYHPQSGNNYFYFNANINMNTNKKQKQIILKTVNNSGYKILLWFILWNTKNNQLNHPLYEEMINLIGHSSMLITYLKKQGLYNTFLDTFLGYSFEQGDSDDVENYLKELDKNNVNYWLDCLLFYIQFICDEDDVFEILEDNFKQDKFACCSVISLKKYIV
jgi:hypothetical protein